MYCTVLYLWFTATVQTWNTRLFMNWPSRDRGRLQQPRTPAQWRRPPSTPTPRLRLSTTSVTPPWQAAAPPPLPSMRDGGIRGSRLNGDCGYPRHQPADIMSWNSEKVQRKIKIPKILTHKGSFKCRLIALVLITWFTPGIILDVFNPEAKKKP